MGTCLRRLGLLSSVVSLLWYSGAPLAANPQTTHSQPAAHTAGGSTYTNKKLNFAVRVPPAWQVGVKNLPGINSVIFAGTKDGNFTPNLVVTVTNSGGQNLKQYVADALQSIHKAYHLQTEDKGATTLAGLPADAILVHGNVKGVSTLVQQQIYCVRGAKGYIVALTTNAELAAKFKSLFDTFVASFRWDTK